MRDSKYYIDDGNAVLLVEDTLFKVHRSMLSRDSSTFESMFTLPLDHSNPSEGHSDDNPIVIHGDTPQQWRSFLWSIYALPGELMIAYKPNFNSQHMINVAHISHKYAFRSIEQWALDALRNLCACVQLPENPSLDFLSTILGVAKLCGNHELEQAVVSSWRKHLTTVPNITHAMNTSEEHDSKLLMGFAYYSMALKGRAVWDSASLTVRQRIRLLSGHYNLLRLFDHMQTAFNPNFPPACAGSSVASVATVPACQHRWIALWKQLWSRTAIDHVNSNSDSGIDVLGRLAVVHGTFTAVPFAGVSKLCQSIAIEFVDLKIEEVERSLHTHFSDVV